MEPLIGQTEFLKKYNIDQSIFNTTNLNWDSLEIIYNDYLSLNSELETCIHEIINQLLKIKKIHSIRSRIKEPEHVIEKIIRKKIEYPSRDITLNNYKNELTDLLGIRVLHLFKEDWIYIHNEISNHWKIKKPIEAYHREGDPKEYCDIYSNNGCELKIHKNGYRSVHYIINSKFTTILPFIEIQVRTLFEEGWSEIDHKLRYPYLKSNRIINNYLLLMNRLAGSADEMASFILQLNDELDELHNQLLNAKSKFEELMIKDESKNTSENEKNDLIEAIIDYTNKLESLLTDSKKNRIPGKNSDLRWLPWRMEPLVY